MYNDQKNRHYSPVDEGFAVELKLVVSSLLGAEDDVQFYSLQGQQGSKSIVRLYLYILGGRKGIKNLIMS